jgi:microcystin-dependent protein
LVDVVGGVNPNGGRFNVIIGGTDTVGASLTAALAATASPFLEIKVGNNAISPRQQILATPRALRADVATTLIAPLQQALCPPGSIMAYGGTTVPAGWLLCDGTSYPRTGGTYNALFAAIGPAYGTADGSHFNVPDLRGRFLRAVDGGAMIDPDKATRTASNPGGNTGDNVGSFQGSAFASHTHGYKDIFFSESPSEFSGFSDFVAVPQNIGASGNDRDDQGLQIDRTSAATGGSTETRPVNITVNYIIKY